MKRSNTRILVVDNHASTRRLICELLRDLGFVGVDEASDAPEAVTLFHQRPYDLVITALRLPHCSGLELLRAVRNGPGRRETAVLVLGDDVSPREVVEVLYAGANGFMAKPLVAHTFGAKVVRIVGKLHPDSVVPSSRSDLWAQA